MGRERAEREARELNAELERRVGERTAQLEAANRSLENEILERKRTEEALRADENRFRSLVENSPEAIALFAADGTILYGGPSTGHVLGYALDEFVGQNVFELLHPDDHKVIKSRLTESLQQSGKRVGVQARIRHKNGSWRWVEGSFTNLLAEPSVQAIVNNYHDITERKRVEEALREREERYRVVVETASDAILTIDADGTIVFVNRAAEKIFGYPRADMLGHSLTMLMPEHLRSVHQASIKRYLDTGERHISWEVVELPGLRKSGKEIPLELSFGEFIKNGKHFFTGIIRDITGRKQAEAALQESHSLLRAVVEGTTDAVVVKDVRGRYVMINPAGARFLGKSVQEVIGKDDTALMSPDTAHSIMDHDRRVMAAGETQTFEEVASAQGVTRTYLSTKGVYRDQRGHVIGLVGISRDISERKQAEEALRRYAERLQTLRDIDQAILAAQTQEAVASAALQRVRQLIPCRRASVAEFDFKAHQATFLAVHADGETSVGTGTRLPVEAFGTAETLRQGKVRVVEDILTLDPLPAVLQSLRAEGLRSYVSVPLVYQGTLIGALNLGADRPGAFVAEHIEIAREVADQLAVAIQQARLHERVQRYAAELEQRVAEREQTYEALRESEQRYRLLFENNPLPMWVYDLETLAFLAVNDAAVHHYGYSREEFLAMTIKDIRPPEDIPAALEKVARVSTLASGVDISSVWRHRKKDGTLIDVEITSHALDFAGRRARVILANDITERRRAEEERSQLLVREQTARTEAEVAELRATFLAEASRLLAESLDYEDTLTRVSRLAVPTLADWCSVDILTEDGSLKRLAVAHTDPEKAEWARELQRRYPPDPDLPYGVMHVLRTGRSEFYPEITDAQLVIAARGNAEILRVLRETSPRSGMLVPLVARGRTLGVLSFALAESERRYSRTDLILAEDLARRAALAIDNARLYTERRRIEEEIRSLNTELEQRVAARTAELEAKNRELETFTYSVSHDLKAPLRGIDGYSRLLLEDYTDRLDEEGRRFLRTIRSATQQMNQLIDDLLAYSRLERRPFDAGYVNLRLLIEALVAERADDIRARNARVGIAIPYNFVSADAEGLAQVLRNLLENALKFTRDVPVPRIEIGGCETNGGWLLWVRDNGVGFDMRYHDRIFGIFQRLHRSEDYPGTGIGLAIVRKALERMGGRVWAESTLGQGATFYVELWREP